ncbi:MAG: hypothetical protein IMW91_01515 [Firmicutes bacterium]|nr:hypothetical protein [Bacillota bacterium]
MEDRRHRPPLPGERLSGALLRVALAGVGALSMTREKAEELVNRWVDRGEVSPGTARRLIDELAERGEEERRRYNAEVRRQIERLVNSLHLVSREEFEALEARVAALEQQGQEKDPHAPTTGT